MNISNGGPHILLFERDQQLTALVTSEFQLAGYECHAARTAVEVFDALARNPIKIVLVDLAQAAAARREFWVALDTQRRGRGVHVLTFQCYNIAGYGPQDPDDRSSTIADLEIDGMLGLVKLVDEVRNRVPASGSVTNTMPRIPKVNNPPVAPPSTMQRTAQQQPPPPMQTSQPTQRNGQGVLSASGTSYRIPSDQMATSQQPAVTRPSQQPPVAPPAAPPSSPAPATAQQTTAAQNASRQSTYTDKIRAVLYPNQRSWTQPENGAPAQTPRPSYEPQNGPQNGQNDSPTLHRLANTNGNTNGNTAQAMQRPEESGLAQLSRLVEESNTRIHVVRPNNGQQMDVQPSTYQSQEGERQTTGPMYYVNPETQSNNPGEKISTQPLRPAPINDAPVERAVGNTGEGTRRPDVLSRTNYGQQQASPVAIPPLASIATAQPSVPVPATPTAPVVEKPKEEQRQGTVTVQEEPIQINAQLTAEELFAAHGLTPNGATDENAMDAKNALLLNIVQSLPPMPPVSNQQTQSAQPQVLSGRATRTLNSVLLAGHLVPQNRLEVAENIQRMLRGVDLNYQLGEILLMFKLLTPDQLLAASLVSYGLITTNQISALGRIRQELHAIGLEYDLENLLILFRILTPEQLREVKTSWLT